jgi:hypothetical protein
MNNSRNYKLIILALMISNLYLIWKLTMCDDFPPRQHQPRHNISTVLKLSGETKHVADSLENDHFAKKTIWSKHNETEEKN